MKLIYEDMVSKESLYDYQSAFAKAGVHKTVEGLSWFHFKNMARTPLVTLVKDIEDKDHLAAIYATFPVKAKVGNEVINACQSLDTLTDKDYQGKGLFVSAAKKRYKRNSEKGFNFVYGFPNYLSVHGFIKRLGWSLLGTVPFLIKPLRTGYFVKKILGNRLGTLIDFPLAFRNKLDLGDNWTIKSISRFESCFDDLWHSFSKEIPVAIERDSHYLNWRYVERPNSNYEILALYKKEKLHGFIVYTSINKHNGRVGYVMELITRPESKDKAKALLHQAQNNFISNKVDFVLAWCFTHAPNYSRETL